MHSTIPPFQRSELNFSPFQYSLPSSPLLLLTFPSLLSSPITYIPLTSPQLLSYHLPYLSHHLISFPISYLLPHASFHHSAFHIPLYTPIPHCIQLHSALQHRTQHSSSHPSSTPFPSTSHPIPLSASNIPPEPQRVPSPLLQRQPANPTHPSARTHARPPFSAAPRFGLRKGPAPALALALASLLPHYCKSKLCSRALW